MIRTCHQAEVIGNRRGGEGIIIRDHQISLSIIREIHTKFAIVSGQHKIFLQSDDANLSPITLKERNKKEILTILNSGKDDEDKEKAIISIGERKKSQAESDHAYMLAELEKINAAYRRVQDMVDEYQSGIGPFVWERREEASQFYKELSATRDESRLLIE